MITSTHWTSPMSLDLLAKWEAKIDIKIFFLTQSPSNPIRIYNSCNVNYYEEIIPAVHIIRDPINAYDGEVLVKEQMISNCIIHGCLYRTNTLQLKLII